MKQYLLRGLFAPKTKASDQEFRDLRTAVLKTAEQKATEASAKLLRSGDVIIEVKDDDAAEQMIKSFEPLSSVVISGVSDPLEAYVQQRSDKAKLTKTEPGAQKT